MLHPNINIKQTSSQTHFKSSLKNIFITSLIVHSTLSFILFRLFRLAEADKEVQEAYKKIALARSKKKSPSKKEKDVAWKALKDREAILKQLESV